MCKKIEIALGDGNTLVAEANTEPDYKEIFIYLKDSEGLIVQDLAVVGEEYKYEEDFEITPIHKSYSVKVYTDETDENWTHDHRIKLYEEPEREGECSESVGGMCQISLEDTACLGTRSEMHECAYK